MVEMNLITLGTLVIIVGFVLAFIGILSQVKGKTKVEGGGIIFIGPIPIVGATSERTFYILLAVSVIFFIVFILLNYLK